LDNFQLNKIYQKHPLTKELADSLKENSIESVQVKGLVGSSRALLIGTIIQHTKGIHLIILTEKEEASYFFDDIARVLGDENVLFFPSSHKRSVQYNQPDSTNIILRTRAMERLSEEKSSHPGHPLTIVTYPEALVEKVVSHKHLKKSTLQLATGENISIPFLTEVLEEYGFKRSDFVYEPGQYSIRGSIVDIFSFSAEFPYRIDFFGDTVNSIRSFEIESQLSKTKFEKISIISNVQEYIPGKKSSGDDLKETFFDFIPKGSKVWSYNLSFIVDRVNSVYENTHYKKNEDDPDSNVAVKDEVLNTGNLLLEKLKTFQVVEFGIKHISSKTKDFEFNTAPQPVFNKDFELLGTNLKENEIKGYLNVILSESEKQIERLKAIFEDSAQNVNFTSSPITIQEGFIDHDLKLCCYTDHQIFERYHKFRLTEKFTKHDTITLQELQGLHPGDYVVHIDHGIGIFGGLQKIDVNGKAQESIRLIYKDNDIVFIPIQSLHRISKYKGKEGEPPKIYKLGSGAWQKLKLATKNKVKDIARDLIALYAKRRTEKGFEYAPDTYLQNELEASFIYEDTPDQLTSTKAVKEDMESPAPMDRLICGDVGFGKTEIAIRAAFKAVSDSKQVAVLVPTTILALQHYKTFKDRLKNFPCTVDYISRMKKDKDQKATLKNLEEGKVDIIIGTHRLIGKDIKFKDLGLLIIDEEQKFGVAVKEKLRKIKVNVDTLTLTATPIPRTLQFSLMGARDLSVITTPPPNRHPIVTELHSFNKDIIREGINFEIQRNGQVFFIHNRVQSIYDLETLLHKICPGVKTAVAHGQMDGDKLEQIMFDFIEGAYDVLLATTIIESGLDIPNANTIFINDAQNFGLSDLHQLRGRVGRSNKKAFCYLLAPSLSVVTPEARRRLKAIEEFSDLGSGFNIAMQDLDIRGAGNLLGGEQSGFIADIGYETYYKILNEAIQELKESEFSDLYAEEKKKEAETKDVKYISDCQIDTDLELLFPDEYISNVSERIRLYRELDNIQTEEKLLDFQKQLEDRFGALPKQSVELLNIVRLRWLAVNLGFERIILKNGKLLVYFITNQMSPYYKSEVFVKVINFIQQNSKLFHMKEGKEKLTMTIDNISGIENAIKLMTRIMNG
jgi:transcription-repair coupling factor (superfamily II helicase)